ncbi:MAG: hypothetical protein RIE56_10965 [Amphiplicatus sp.]
MSQKRFNFLVVFWAGFALLCLSPVGPGIGFLTVWAIIMVAAPVMMFSSGMLGEWAGFALLGLLVLGPFLWGAYRGVRAFAEGDDDKARSAFALPVTWMGMGAVVFISTRALSEAWPG